MASTLDDSARTMPSPQEALTQLRAHVIKGRGARVEGEELVLLDVNEQELARLPKHAPTAYHSKSAKKPYDLLAVYTCFKYAHLTFGEYVTKCRAEKAALVSTVDKKELLAFLKGDIETSAQIVGTDGGDASTQEEEQSMGDVAVAGGNRAQSEQSASAVTVKEAASSSRERDDQNETNPTKRAAHVSEDGSGKDTESASAKKRKLDDASAESKAHGRRHHHHASRDKENKRVGAETGSGSVTTTTTTTMATNEEKEAELAMKSIMEKEYTHRNRSTVLLAAKKSFETVLKSVETANAETNEKIEKANKTSALPPVTARKEQLPLSQLMKNKISGVPIIVVPAGFSDLLTMLNIQDFLVDGDYVSNMQKKSEGCRKAQSLMITHEEDGEQYMFQVVDSVTRFRDKDWRRVVGVIASGQSWQFKGWRWKFPVEVFKKVCGVHVYNQGSQLGDDIKQWDVKLLMIHPDKRHLDKVASREFWRYLFEFLKHKLQ